MWKVLLSPSKITYHKALCTEHLKDQIAQTINAEKLLIIDYISVADGITLLEISGEIKGGILVSVAVYLGKTRLIDNFSYSGSSKRQCFP